MTDGLRRVPAWLWLAGIVAASFLVRAWLARGMFGPFIMVDELIYSELAKSFASDLAFSIREVPTRSYGPVYPILIAPAYAAFTSIPDAYGALKSINSLIMSLAAIPAYLIARHVVRRPLALLAAIGDVAHPSWRASSVGVYRLWRDLGYAIGALLAGVIADAFGVPAAVWSVAALTLVSGAVVAVRMRETLAPSVPEAA